MFLGKKKIRTGGRKCQPFIGRIEKAEGVSNICVHISETTRRYNAKRFCRCARKKKKKGKKLSFLPSVSFLARAFFLVINDVLGFLMKKKKKEKKQP